MGPARPARPLILNPSPHLPDDAGHHGVARPLILSVAASSPARAAGGRGVEG